MSFLANEFVLISLVGAIAFIVSYIGSEKTLSWLHSKTLGSREYVLEKLELMYVDTNVNKVTASMIAISFGPGILVVFALLPNLVPGLILGTAVIIGGWQVPKLVIDYLYEKRSSQFADQMVDGLTLLSNGVRSGLTVPQAMERVVDNMANPISQEFALVLSQIRLGLSLEEALNNLGDRIPLPDVQMFVTAVNILKETGGDMSQTFGTIVETIRERQKVQRKIETLTAQGLMQGVIITLVPFFLLVMFSILDPEYIKPMFTTTFGIVMLFIMLTLQVIGGLAIKKIVKIKV